MMIDINSDKRFPICYECQEPIIEGETFYRLYTKKNGMVFVHTDCMYTFRAEYMPEGGAE